MANPFELQFIAETKGLQGGLDGIGSKVGGLSKAVGAGMLGAGAGIAAFGALAVNAAADVAESQNKVNVVFGASADKINALASTSAQALGQTKGQVLEATGTFGNLLTAMGQTPEKAADMSIGMVKLASDLASFNNADPTEVLEALRSGMSGEAEPMKRFGVALNEVSMANAAVAAGLISSVDDWGKYKQGMSEAEKQQLRYNIMMEQTKTAQGDFANTSGGMANAMRIIKASVGSAVADIGAGLLPAVQKVAAAFSSFLASGRFEEIKTQLISVFTQIGDKLAAVDWGALVGGAVGLFEKLGGVIGFLAENPALGMLVAGITGVIAAIAPVAAIVGPLIPIFGALFGAIGTIAGVVGPAVAAIGGIAAIFNPVTLAVGAVVAAIVGLKLAWDNNLGGIQEKVAGVVGAVQGIWSGFVGFLQSNAETIKTILLAIVTGGLSLVVQGWQQHGDEIKAKAADIAAGVQGKWDEMKAGIAAKSDEIKANVSQAWNDTKAAISDALSQIWSDLKLKWDAFLREISDKLQAILGAVQTAWTSVKTAISDAMAAVQAVISSLWSAIVGAVQGYLERLKGNVEWAFGLVQQVISGAMGIVQQVVSDVLGAITRLWDEWRVFVAGVVEAFKRLISGDWQGAFTAMKDAAERGLQAVIGFFRDLGGSIMRAIGDAGRLLLDVGGSIVDGLWQGISRTWDNLLRDIGGLINRFPQWLLDLIRGGSPALEFVPVGESMAEGVGYGFVGFWRRVVEPMMRRVITPPILPPFEPILPPPPPKKLPGGDDEINPPIRSIGEPAPEPGPRPKAKWEIGTPAGFPEGPDVAFKGIAPGVKVSAMRTGRGGFVAASKTNFWRQMLQRWGLPEETSARKVAQQLGIPIPDWLEQMWHPVADAKETDLSLQADKTKTPEGAGAAVAASLGGLSEAIVAATEIIRAAVAPIAGPSVPFPRRRIVPPDEPGPPGTWGRGAPPVTINFRPSIRAQIDLGTRVIAEAIEHVLPETTYRGITAPQGG